MSEHNSELTSEEAEALRKVFRDKREQELISSASIPDADNDETLPDVEYNLPDDETLIKFADGTLRGRECQRIRELAQESATAMAVVAGFVKEYSPVRRLAQPAFGLKGALLSTLNRLPTDVSREDWERHLARNARARRQENVVRWFCTEPLLNEQGREKPRQNMAMLVRMANFVAVPLLIASLTITYIQSSRNGTTAPEVIYRGDANIPPAPPVQGGADLTKLDDDKLTEELDRYSNPGTPDTCMHFARLNLEKARRTQDKDSKEEYQKRAVEFLNTAAKLLKSEIK